MNKQWKNILVLSMAFVTFFLITGCGGNKTSGVNPGSNSKIKVVATIYPVYEFIKQVGGDKVDVSILVPPGAEPHDWEPTARDLMRIKEAKVFAYHGAGFEPIEKLLTKEVLGSALPVEVSKDVPKLASSHKDDAHNDDKHENDAQHEEGHGEDSHMWLDPLSAVQEVNNILAALIAVDEPNAAYYKANAEAFTKQLLELDQEYKTTLGNVGKKDIITSHEAFGYLAARYGLRQVGIMGLSPDAEPTPDRLAEITRFCRDHQVKYIFFETIASPKLSQTLAKETGAELLVLNPAESLTEQEIKDNKNYLIIMRENLSNLKKALQ